MNVPVVPVITNVGLESSMPEAWHDQTLVLELEALLDARKALIQELLALDGQISTYFSRLLPQTSL